MPAANPEINRHHVKQWKIVHHDSYLQYRRDNYKLKTEFKRLANIYENLIL